MRRFLSAFYIVAIFLGFQGMTPFLGFQGMIPGAAAQTAGGGLLNAVAYLPLPKGQSIAVRPLDNSDENLILQKVFENALRAQGYGISDTADLILSFETRGEIGAWSETGRRHVIELHARGGQEGGEDAKARLNLFDSNKGGVFNRGHSGTSIVTPSQYRIDATIDSRTDGKRLWQAWSTANLSGRDSLDLTQAMIPEMVKNLGQTVKQRPINLK